MKINRNNAKKLRCGHTIWRCLLGGGNSVHISEFILTGRKVNHAFRSCVNGRTYSVSKRIITTSQSQGGVRTYSSFYQSYFLDDIHGHGSEWVAAFTTRREALRFKAAVEAGRMPAAVQARAEFDAEEDRWSYDDYHDDRYDAFDDYTGPDAPPQPVYEPEPPVYAYTKPMTLGELLRMKLAEKPVEADEFAEAV